MRPPVRPPRLRCGLFPSIYLPHLLVLPATFGLRCFLPSYPYFPALYVVSVRQVRGLPTASFRFHLTVNTLAVQLCASSLPTRTRDFHPLEPAHGGRTKNSGMPKHAAHVFSKWQSISILKTIFNFCKLFTYLTRSFIDIFFYIPYSFFRCLCLINFKQCSFFIIKIIHLTSPFLFSFVLICRIFLHHFSAQQTQSRLLHQACP